ncbi:hypothetical protein CPB83DRAFT_908921 [Crepidotus variabilis]|uniref:NACHT domain-containing protein n=1 Tax=Crepidotus variabilis TaxID=179855 RepID=A0A9P6EBA6_9AGAR|nr:hypothetical protein CPB83DRAFT_908921 [Crepidotus variabilis]
MAATAGVFNNAANVALTNAQVNVNVATTHNHHHPEHSLRPLSRLYSHCAPGAFLNSAERPDPPKCSPTTRQKLLVETKGFATADSPTPSVLWLTGSAGSGKTAICQSTAEELKEEGYVLGCHFFFRSSRDGKCSDGHCWVPNLVHEMVRIFPETLPYVVRIIRSNDSVFNQQPDGVLEELFLNSLKATRFSFRRIFQWVFGNNSTIWPSVTRIPSLIIVDGLDECESTEMQVHILKAIANIIPKLPIPIRFLIASRPETHLRAAINDLFGHVPLHCINLDEDQDIRKDLEKYYHNRFNAIRRDHSSLRGREAYIAWPPQKHIEALIAKSSTQFIFASTVMNYISDRRGNPFTRLDVVLGIKVTPQKDKPYLELDILYRIILLTVQEDERQVVFLILSFIYLAGKGEYPDLQLRASPEFLEQLLKLEVGDVPRFLDPLVSILSLPETPSGTITMLHASFFDYLCDPSRSEDLAMKFDKAHEVMALKVIDVPSTLANSNVLCSCLLHASRASMSISLILALFALEQSIIGVIRGSYPSFASNKPWLADYASQINTLLVSRLGGQLPARHDSIFDPLGASSELERHQHDMANLIIQFVTDGIDESTLTSLIHQLQSGLNNSEWPLLSGEPTNNICRPLVGALIQVSSHKREKLYRKDVVKLLQTPGLMVGPFPLEAHPKYVREILEFIQEFRRRSLSSKFQVAGISPVSIIHLEELWAKYVGQLPEGIA